MIRRIILFLWILFVGFFAYRRYDKTAADNFLYKIKNLSFSKSTYTTTITDANGSGQIVSSDAAWKLLKEMSDIVVNTTWSTTITNDQIVQQILNEENLEQGVIVPWMSGRVITQTGPIETISAQPIVTTKTTSSSSQPQSTLSAEDKRQAEEFSQMFSD